MWQPNLEQDFLAQGRTIRRGKLETPVPPGHSAATDSLRSSDKEKRAPVKTETKDTASKEKDRDKEKEKDRGAPRSDAHSGKDLGKHTHERESKDKTKKVRCGYLAPIVIPL